MGLLQLDSKSACFPQERCTPHTAGLLKFEIDCIAAAPEPTSNSTSHT